MPTILLNSKLYRARLRPNLVARPRLLEKLDRGLQAGYSMSMVSAPAGYGKTTLLNEWLRLKEGGTHNVAQPSACGAALSSPASIHHPPRVAWLALDEADNDPVRFWAYVILSLQAIHDELGETALTQLRSPQPPPIQLLLPDLLNDTESLRQPTVLVLDDYHLIRNTGIHESIAFVLEHLPSTLHVVLSTRTDPPLPLARLRANNLITEVRTSDLRFTLEEATTFLNDCKHLELSAENVMAIVEQTEGWIAGLQLAALSLEGRDAASRAQVVTNFSGRQQFILDYLADEVLSRQPESVQSFLLQTSILEHLTGSLCDAVTQRRDSEALLEHLNKANMFLVPLDREGTWYRYHHLFAGLLRARLRESPSEQLTALHARAAGWCEQNGFVAEAVQHALAAQDLERATQLIKRAARNMFGGSEQSTLVGWLDAMPEDCVCADPQLNMIYAWALLATNRMDVVNPHLEAVERAVGFVADGSPEYRTLPTTVRGALAEVLCIRSNLAFHSRDPLGVLRLSEWGLGYLAEDVQGGLFQLRRSMQAILAFNRGVAHELLGDVRAAEGELNAAIAIEPQNRHVANLVNSHLAGLYITQGRLRQAAELCRAALRHAVDGPRPPIPFAGMAHAELGTILSEWNQLEDAESHLRQGLELGHQWSNLETLVLAYVGLARIKEARGDHEDALGLMEELCELARNLKTGWAIKVAEAHQARLWAQLGNRGMAAHWVQDTAVASQEMEAIILARVLLALGDPDRALALLKTLGQAAEAGGRTGRSIEILMLQALASHAQGKTAEARSSLEASLALAEPEGYTRVFLDEGDQMFALLKQVTSHGVANTYVSLLLAGFENCRGICGAGKSTASARSDSVDQLTGRELEVLRLLSEGLSNQEMAQKLYLSPNTVRVYTYNIYSKLDVHNRMQAVLKAGELGFLPLSR